MKPGWIKGLIYSLILSLVGGPALAQPFERIVFVKSSDNAYFNQTIDTLVDNLERSIEHEVVLARDLNENFRRQDSNRLVVALGEAAVESLKTVGSRDVTINSYLTHEQYDNLALSQQTTVLLDQPLERYLAFSKIALGIDSLGIIERQTLELARRQQQLLQQLGLDLTQHRVDGNNKLLPVLRSLLRYNDALLMLPNQSIYNRESLKGILLTSYRNRKPAISYSPAHVKSGALASIYSSPGDIGKHLALLINQKINNPSRALPGYEYARFYSIAINRRVAHALSIQLPDADSIRTRMEELDL